MRAICCAILASALATAASAEVIGGRILEQTGAGHFMKLGTETPFEVGNDSFDDCNLYAFDEDQNITITEAIKVDFGGIGGEIPAGTVVASHYVFFDSLNGMHLGFVDFDAPILGVAAFQDTMGATDYLANTNVTYLSEELRGLERGDQIQIDPENPNRLWVFWAGSSPGDYVRVFTEKSSGALFM